MKSKKNILIAFLLNLGFSVFELVGGMLCGSVAIISDALHDFGDAFSLGIAFFLEKKSLRQPDKNYTYGYGRFSVLGGLVTTCILIFGSLAVIFGAISRAFNPVPINYNGMIIFAIIGTLVNLCAVFFTRHASSINEKSVNLHMLEDVLGWIVVLIGAVLMRFTDFALIDTLISIAVAIFILINGLKNLIEIMRIFLLKTPKFVNVDEVLMHLTEIDGVLDVHHIHLFTVDGQSVYATLHAVMCGDAHNVKHKIKSELLHLGIVHATVETENEGEVCNQRECKITPCEHHTHHHGHHH